MSKLVQFTDDVHFPDLNPNSYENLNKVKLDLKCLHKVNQSQCKLVYKLGRLQVSSKCFALYFLKATHLGICRMESFAREVDLIYIPSQPFTYNTHCDSSHIFIILPNVRSTINGKKNLIQICNDMEWALDSKNKILLPS